MKDLEKKIKKEIKRIIEEEMSRSEDDKFKFLDSNNEEHLNLIFQILNSERFTGSINPEHFREDGQIGPRQKAELIFIAAPTGAGKDTLVMKITHDNPDKKYVVLNMDMFRTYYPIFLDRIKEQWPEGLNDKDFARQTNGFSYEIYYTIQRILLDNFPGTNVIITGTIRETDWVEKTFRDFKSNPYTQYTNKMFALAVPKNVCAYSANYRYVELTEINEEGTSRFVDMDYYNDTIQNFITNLKYFEGMLATGVIDVIRVYKRSRNQYDFKEDTLLYESSLLQRKNEMVAARVASRIMNVNEDLEMKIKVLLDRVESKKEYFVRQGVYDELIESIKALEGRELNNSIDSNDNKNTVPKITEGKYPGCDD